MTKRPHSAKAGRNSHHQHSQDYSDDFKFFQKEQLTSKTQKNKNRLYSGTHFKHKLNISKPLELQNAQFTRLMPNHINQQKQRLYFQTMKLKQKIHQMTSENLKLKTKVAALDQQKQRMSKICDDQYISNKLKLNSTRTLNSNETGIVAGLKKIIRDYKQQIEILKNENIKIKKTIKYTKINEIEIEIKYLHQQNARLKVKLLENARSEMQEQRYRMKIGELQSQLKNQISQNDKLIGQNSRFTQQIINLQEMINDNNKKFIEKQKKVNKDFELTKKKLQETNRELVKAKQQILKISQNKSKYKQNAEGQKMIINNISNNNSNQELKQKKQLMEQIEMLKKHNIQLENNLQLVNSKLKVQQSLLNQNKKINSDKKQKQDQNLYNQQFDEQQKIDFNLSRSQFKNEIQNHKQMIQQQNKPIPQQIVPKNQNTSQILYQKQINQNKKKKKHVNNKKRSSELEQLSELLTFRMKAQRYPFQELKSDIYQSHETNFKLQDIQSMLMNTPFFFNQKQTHTLLVYFFETKKLDLKMTISIDNFVNKIETLLKDFQLTNQKQQQQMYIRITQLVTTYAAQLEAAFQQNKNGENTINRKELESLFTQLQLPYAYIDLIISELSMVSEDLEHLNFLEFFKKFYMDENEVREVDEQYEKSDERTLNRHIIAQEQQSDQISSKNQKNKKKSKIQKNYDYQEY